MKRRPYGAGSLWAEVRKSGKVWCAQVWHHGRQHQKVLGLVRRPGTRDGMTRSQAEAALREFRQGVEGSSTSTSRSISVTLEHAADAHLRHLEVVRRRKTNTVENYRSIIETHLYPTFGRDQSVRTITREGVQDLVDQLLSSKAHGTSVNVLAVLFSIMARAEREGWVDKNVVAQVERPRATHQPEIEYLTPEQVELLLDAAEDLRERATYALACMCGLRMGELRALTWGEVDLDAHVVRVVRSFTKGRMTQPKSFRSTRAVPLPRTVEKTLAECRLATPYSSDDDWVLGDPQSGKMLADTTAGERFKKALERAGLPEMKFHSQRHCFATALMKGGIDVRTVMHLCGHASFATTMQYAHFHSDAARDREMVERAFRTTG